jgi:hypothetical protein
MSPEGVTQLVPFVHVRNVAGSLSFYRHFGFEVANTYVQAGELVWCSLVSGGARLMLAKADAPVVAEEQAVLFYLYAEDLDALREQLLHAGIDAGPIVDGSPGPEREMRVSDPDGWCLMVAESKVLSD